MARGRLLYIGSKMVQMVIVLWAIATILFLIFRLMPGNPLTAYIDPTFTEEQAAEVRKQFGLDKPLIVQYGFYLKNLANWRFRRFVLPEGTGLRCADGGLSEHAHS